MADSDDSDLELPKKTRLKEHTMKDNQFLKMYRSQNAVHCRDREAAVNIKDNLFRPNKEDRDVNPYLNRNMFDD